MVSSRFPTYLYHRRCARKYLTVASGGEVFSLLYGRYLALGQQLLQIRSTRKIISLTLVNLTHDHQTIVKHKRNSGLTLAECCYGVSMQEAEPEGRVVISRVKAGKAIY